MLAALLGLAIGLTRGGRLDGLAHLSLRAFPLLLVGIALVLAAEIPWRTPLAAPALTGAGYAAALVMLWANRDRPWVPVVCAGAALNGAVIFANGGRMPVPASAFERIGRPLPAPLLAGTDPRHVLAGSGTHFGWLADHLVAHAGPFITILSVGDVILAVGLAALVQTVVLEGTA